MANKHVDSLRCLLVIGLPGSGKTHYARNLGPGWTILDDPSGPQDLPSILDGNLVITSPWFCDTKVLDTTIRSLEEKWPDVTIETAFFENDPETCQCNAKKRPGRDVRGLIFSLSSRYVPGEDAMAVWKGDVNDRCGS